MVYERNGSGFLTRDEESFYLNSWILKRNQRAKEILIIRNIPFIKKIARNYRGRGLDLQDLVNEGVCGFIKALNSYDLSKGFRLNTYAEWFIKQAIIASLLSVDGIRLKNYLKQKLNKIMRAVQDLRMELNRNPTLEEIADKADLDIAEVKKALEARRIARTLPDISDTIPSEKFDPTRIPIIRSELRYIDSKLREYEVKKNSEKFAEFKISSNPKRLVDIFRSYFGLDGSGEGKTLQSTGIKFNLTKQRIDQAIKKIKPELLELGLTSDQLHFLECIRTETMARDDEFFRRIA